MDDDAVRDDLAEIRDQIQQVHQLAQQTLTQATLTNGRVTALETDWWGPHDERLARTETGWRSRVKDMYAESKDRAAVMRAVKWLAGFVGFQTFALVAYLVVQIGGGGG